MRILVVNPGSTSTKLALFDGEAVVNEANLQVPHGDSADPWEEYPLRLRDTLDWLTHENVPLSSLSCVVGRGGLFRPLEGGTYRVSDPMVADARANLHGPHASNLGCALAQCLADRAGEEGEKAVQALVVDPVSTDEFVPQARYSGLKEIPRRSLSHALSIHSLVREVCRSEDIPLDQSSFVVAHLGGGISVSPVRGGRILDVNNANSGGPFSPSRAGGLPVQELLDLAFSGEYTRDDLRAMTVEWGGLKSYLGTDDALEVEKRIRDGDLEAEAVYRAMAYQVAKEIGAMATVLNGEFRKILLTGGLAASSLLTGWIRDRVGFLGPVEAWPEVGEMRALARGGLRILRGEEVAKEY